MSFRDFIAPRIGSFYQFSNMSCWVILPIYILIHRLTSFHLPIRMFAKDVDLKLYLSNIFSSLGGLENTKYESLPGWKNRNRLSAVIDSDLLGHLFQWVLAPVGFSQDVYRVEKVYSLQRSLSSEFTNPIRPDTTFLFSLTQRSPSRNANNAKQITLEIKTQPRNLGV